jgi:PASTA domain
MFRPHPAPLAVRTPGRHGTRWAGVHVHEHAACSLSHRKPPGYRGIVSENAAQGATGRSFEDDYDEFEARLLTDPTFPARIADELEPEMFAVIVPAVIAMTRERARTVLHRARLIAVGPGPDGAPLEAVSEPDDVVTDQSPEAGTKVPSRTKVMLWTDRRGGSGVREPRRPMPDPKSGRAMRDESTGDVVN